MKFQYETRFHRLVNPNHIRRVNSTQMFSCYAFATSNASDTQMFIAHYSNRPIKHPI
jgi:hypothetical protein